MDSSRVLVTTPAVGTALRDRSAFSRGWARAANAAWWDADFDVDLEALHVYRLGHVQPHLRLGLERIRSLQQTGTFGRSFREVDLTTTTGAVINLRWCPVFGERVVQALRATLDRPPAPLPVPGALALTPGRFPGVRKVGAPDLAEESRAALRSVVRGTGLARLERSQGRRRLRRD